MAASSYSSLKCTLSKFQTMKHSYACCVMASSKRSYCANFRSATPVNLSHSIYGPKVTSEAPVLIMHGLMGSKQNWNSISKAINARTSRQVISVDLRNHGDSPHTSEMSYNHMAVDIKHLIKQLSLPPVVLLGHSMGGRAAMHLALNQPALIERLVVVDISPIGSSPSLHGMKRYFEALRSVHFENGMSMSTARKSADQQLSGNISDPAVRQFLITNLVPDGERSYKWRVNLDALEANFSSEIAQFPNPGSAVFSKPVLLIAGAQSDYVKKSDEPAIRKIFPAIEFKYLENAGHWVHAEQPQNFLEILFSFIQK